MGFTLVDTENLEEQDSLGKYTLVDEVYKPPKTSTQKGAEAILSAIGPGADVAKGLVRGLGQFGGSVVDLFSQLGTLAEQSRLAKAMRRRPEELDLEKLGKSYGSEALTEKLASLGVQEPETVLGRTAQRLGSYGPFAVSSPLLSLAQAGVGQLAEELGAGEGLQTAAEIATPFAGGAAKSLAKIPSAIRAVKSNIGNVSKYASGLEKPLAAELEGKLLKRAGVISPERKTSTLDLISEKASDILEKIKSKLPDYDKFIEGFDFKEYHKNLFSEVQDIAKLHKEPIKVDSFINFLVKKQRELQKIPNLVEGEKKALEQIKGFLNKQRRKLTPLEKKEITIAKKLGTYTPDMEVKYKPTMSLEILEKSYRNLNSELGDILLTKSLKGKQKEFADFINESKNQITNIYESQLGPNNKFVKLFKTSNKSYENYQRILDLEKNLQTIVGTEFKPNDWVKLAKNTNTDKLIKIVGKEMTKEIQQLALDVMDAQKSIKKIKNSESFLKGTKLLGGLALGLFSKFVSTPIGLSVAGGDLARYGLGYILTKPSRIKAFRAGINELKKGNFVGYKNALAPLIRDMENEDLPED